MLDYFERLVEGPRSVVFKELLFERPLGMTPGAHVVHDSTLVSQQVLHRDGEAVVISTHHTQAPYGVCWQDFAQCGVQAQRATVNLPQHHCKGEKLRDPCKSERKSCITGIPHWFTVGVDDECSWSDGVRRIGKPV